MDNCTIHTSEEIEKAIKKKGAKLIYLSPYSPDFSPIEHLWSKLKNLLRSIKTTNYRELAKAIEFAFNQVTLSDMRNWFTHCCYCTSSFWETLYDRNQSQKPLHIVSAWSASHQLVLGQKKVNKKSNEVTAIPALLELLEIEESIITIDARLMSERNSSAHN